MFFCSKSFAINFFDPLRSHRNWNEPVRFDSISKNRRIEASLRLRFDIDDIASSLTFKAVEINISVPAKLENKIKT